MYRYSFKHFFDFILSAFGLLLLSPVILIIIICLLYVNKGKPFFLQERPGKKGKIFKIIKFKTMRDPKAGEDVHSPERITKIGSFIRKYSLDEILQLVNVLIGDMSLVGPRPLLIQYLPLYNDEQSKRHDVRPGVTGWAQVKGRNAISWPQKFEYDIWYVDNLSFFLDLKILFLTANKVFKKEGIYSQNNTIMPVWKSNL